jgi:amino acid transporter
MVVSAQPDGVVARIRNLLLGNPLPTSEAGHQRLSRPRALGAFGLDALSSVAYGPDEILYVLVLAGAAGTRFNVPIALAIVALLAIVVTSYRQTIFAYPQGGGSYTVARENLGTTFGLIAAAALMVDYLTTVAVSVTAGIEALVALWPGLDPHRVALDVVAIVLLMFINLRGLKEAGAFFVLPTYIFIGSLAALLAWGFVRMAAGNLPTVASHPPLATESVTVLLILRAFAGGCTAMTGVEAIANGVPAFAPPSTKNAAGTLVTLGTLLAALFLGVVILGNQIHALPSGQASVIAQIGQTVAGNSPLFWLVQVSLAVILVLAANTSFNGFPLLAAVIARDGYMPHQFVHQGQRLAYSNGILVLGVLAIALVVGFGGSTHALIPLFAVGVFLCFTLSQAGMVVHWLHVRERHWLLKLAINGLGAATTALVTAIVVVVKFPEGAWLVAILIPGLVFLFSAIHTHYLHVERELQAKAPPLRPDQIVHTVLVPFSELTYPALLSLAYARAIARDVRGVHIASSDEDKERIRAEWEAWGNHVPLVILESPYRQIVEPLLAYIEACDQEEPGNLLTVVLPEYVPNHWWENVLHNQTALRLKATLLYRPRTVVIDVPYHPGSALPDRRARPSRAHRV